MTNREPPGQRSFADCGEDLTKYRTEAWLAGLSRKTWAYLQRLATAALTTDEDDAWLAHELEQTRSRYRTIEWLRTVNLQRKAD